MLDLLRELPAKADRDLFKVERWCTPDEGMALYTLCQAREIRSYLECGTANGYSALWARAAGAQVDTWDIHDRPKIWQFAPFSATGIVFHCGPFDEGVGSVHAPGPRLFMIDGHHTRRAVRRDWKAVRLLIQKGDVIVFHDANMDGIADLCQNLRLIHGYRGGIVRTARDMGVFFA